MAPNSPSIKRKDHWYIVGHSNGSHFTKCKRRNPGHKAVKQNNPVKPVGFKKLITSE